MRRRLIEKQDSLIPYHTDTAQKLTEILDSDREQEEEIIEIISDKIHARLLPALEKWNVLA
jgi:hypothetical protein